MVNRIPSIRFYLVVALSISTLSLGTGSPVSSRQNEHSKTAHRGQISDLDHAEIPEHLQAEVRRDESSGRENSEVLHGIENPTLASNGITTISGQLATNEGRGIANVELKLKGEDGNSKSTIANSFGYFQFSEVSLDQRITITTGINGRYICTPITMYITGVSSANFTCTLHNEVKAVNKNRSSPPCVNQEIIARHLPPDDLGRPASAPIVEPQDCRNSE